jgi:protease IV
VSITNEVESALERRQLKRRVWRWRIAFLALAIIGLLTFFSLGEGFHPFGRGAQIARIDIAGLITEDRDKVDLLKKAGDDPNVKAVLLAVDSPGGTTTGGEELYTTVGALAKQKPVVAVCGTIATSAAYMISLAADRIVARGNTITGSVGVIFQYPEVDEALDKLGVKMHEIKSGPLKAAPSMFSPLDDQGKQLVESLVKEGQVWFLGLVIQRRGITPSAIPGLEAGSIYSGRQAVQYKLIDALGGQEEAVAWLESEKHVAPKLPIIDWKPRRHGPWYMFSETDQNLWHGLGAAAAEVIANLFGHGQGASPELDGLQSVWHAGPN